MWQKKIFALAAILVLALMVTFPAAGLLAGESSTDTPDLSTTESSVLEAYGKLPLLFIENQGQEDEAVRYYVKASGQTVYFTEENIVFDLVRSGGTEADDTANRLVFPQPRLVLIEPTTKKTAFLHHIIRKLELENVEVLNSRAEEAAHLPLYREQFALVLSRAVALLPTLVELTLPFCQIGGRFIAQKKGEIDQEINKAKKAIAALGGKLDQIKKIELDEFDDARYLVIIDKIYPTPDKYPRRPGLPKRRPI
jgi:Predicted S-adenosylmethionine-dependent methyltransferase involved in bacterial cell division